MISGSTEELLSGYLESLTQVSGLALLHTDGDGRASYVSQAWTSLSGLDQATSLDRGWLDAVHPADRDAVVALWRDRASSHGDGGDGWGCRLVRPGGDVRQVQVRIAPIVTSGRARGVLVTVEDVTHREATEEALRRLIQSHDLSHRRIQALFNYSLDAIFFADDAARYVEANPAACELLGQPRKLLFTRTLADISNAPTPQEFERRWLEFLSRGEQSGIYEIRRPDGTHRTVEYRAIANVLAGTHLFIVRDVTDRQAAERARQQYVQRLELLAAIDRAILAAESPATIADAVVGQVAQLFPAARVSVSLFDEYGYGVVMAMWSRLQSSLGRGATFPMLEPRSVMVRSGEPAVVTDLRALAERTHAEDLLLAEGILSYMRVPLRAQSDVIGSLNIGSHVVDGFTHEHLAAATEVADRLAVAIRNARLLEQLQRSTKTLAGMSKRLLEVQERERRDIARELHDEIGQVLTALKLQLDRLRQDAPPAQVAPLKQAELLANDLVSTVRRLTFDLRPPMLDEFGLRRALSAHLDRFTNQTGVEVAFAAPTLGDRRLALDVESAAFRIVQESLTNVARHAAVAQASVDLGVTPAALTIRVRDEGQGFDASATERWGGGLSGIHERLTLLGGTLCIRSRPGEGTTIEATIPLGREGRFS